MECGLYELSIKPHITYHYYCMPSVIFHFLLVLHLLDVPMDLAEYAFLYVYHPGNISFQVWLVIFIGFVSLWQELHLNW